MLESRRDRPYRQRPNGYLGRRSGPRSAQWGLHEGPQRNRTQVGAGCKRAGKHRSCQIQSDRLIRGRLSPAAADRRSIRRAVARRGQAFCFRCCRFSAWARAGVDVLLAEQDLSIGASNCSRRVDQQRQLAAIERLIGVIGIPGAQPRSSRFNRPPR